MEETRYGPIWGKRILGILDGETCLICGATEKTIEGSQKHDLDKHDAYERTFRPTLGKLTPYGYLSLPIEESNHRLFELVFSDPHAKLVDIRYSPLSYRNFCWSRKALTQVYWGKYEWLQDLGNVNYKERAKGIELLNPAKGIPHVVSLLRDGYNVVLLCACKDYETCHRKVVTDLVKQALPEVEVNR